MGFCPILIPQGCIVSIMSLYTQSDLINAGYSYQELVNANITPPFPDDSIYLQRRARIPFNIPLTRNVIENPYATHTEEELNLRRKVEILKHNTGSNQTKLTKRQQWAQIVRGNYNTNNLSIPADANVVMSSATANVPGPNIPLAPNYRVPLYAFKTSTAVPGFNNVPPEPLPEWSINNASDVICYPSIENASLATLFIRPTIKSPYYTYRYTTPVVATIQGSYLPVDTSGCTITAIIRPVAFKVYYNQSQVQNSINTIASLTTDTIQLDLTPSVDLTDPTIETFDFRATIRLGDLAVENIFLYTEPNYVYTFRITYFVQYVITNSSSSLRNSEIQKRLQVRLLCNPSDLSSSTEPINCRLTTQDTDSIYGNSFNT